MLVDISKCLIIIPTFNESSNIESLINLIFKLHKDISILIVDDNSPDGTYDIVKRLQSAYKNLHLVVREKKSGIAKAYIDGFNYGIQKGYEYFLQIDADFSHNPIYIDSFLELLADYDCVIGSRNVKGGGVEGWGIIRNIISKGGSLYSRIILGLDIKDLTGGFNAYSKNAIEKIGLDSIISEGYCYQVEMKYKAFKHNLKIKEFPIIFTDRQRGESKMSLKIALEAFYKIFKIRF